MRVLTKIATRKVSEQRCTKLKAEEKKTFRALGPARGGGLGFSDGGGLVSGIGAGCSAAWGEGRFRYSTQLGPAGSLAASESALGRESKRAGYV